MTSSTKQLFELGVYVAAASAEIDRAERAIEHARNLGLWITKDWTIDVRKAMAAGLRDSDLSREEARTHALHDFEGVSVARVVILLAPPRDVNSTGCWAELGYALSPYPHRRHVLVSRERARRRSIFEALATPCSNDREAVFLAAAMLVGDDRRHEDGAIITPAVIDEPITGTVRR